MNLPPERRGHAAPADLAERRAGLAAAVAAGYWRTDPAPKEVQISGVRCLRFLPSGASRGTIIHMHGGAFRIGCPEQIAPFAQALAQACAVTVICPAYRLAPEHPFPAGLSDCLAVLRALEVFRLTSNNHPFVSSEVETPGSRAQPIGVSTSLDTNGEWGDSIKCGNAIAEAARHPLILSGDSAGGGLAASLAALAHQAGIPLAGLALLSAWLDLSVTDPAYTTNAATDPLFSAEAAREVAKLYLQRHAPSDPLASPLLGEVSGFPATYVSVGTGEVLAGDAQRLRDRFEQAGVPVTLHAVDGMEHVAVTRDMALVGSEETFAGLVGFVERAITPPPPSPRA